MVGRLTLPAFCRDMSVAPLFIARLISSIGVGLGQLALAWGVLDLGYGAGGLSLVLACKAVPALLIVFGGIAGDRYRRHQVIAAAEALAAVTWLGLGVCFLTGRGPLPLLCVLAGLSGIATAIFLPTIRGIIADLLPSKDRPTGNALISQTQSVGLLVGLATSGLMVAAAGAGWAAIARAVACAISAVLLLRLRTSRWLEAREGLLVELRTGWREFTAHRWVWVLSLQFTAVIMAAAVFTDIAGPLYMADGHGGSQAWGIITACEGIGALIGAALGVRWKSARTTIVASVLPGAGAIPMFLLGSESPWIFIALVTLLPGACQAIYYVQWTTSLQETFPPEVLIRVTSWNIIAGYALMPVILTASGPVVETIGPQSTSLATGVLVVLASLLAYLALRKSVRDARLSAEVDQATPSLT